MPERLAQTQLVLQLAVFDPRIDTEPKCRSDGTTIMVTWAKYNHQISQAPMMAAPMGMMNPANMMNPMTMMPMPRQAPVPNYGVPAYGIPAAPASPAGSAVAHSPHHRHHHAHKKSGKPAQGT
jgi:hypothetical protein